MPDNQAPPVVRLTCPSCGGSLAVPSSSTEYLACGYCGASLYLRRSQNQITLEFAQQMGQAVGQAVGQQIGQRISTVGQDINLHLRYQELAQDRARAEYELHRIGERLQVIGGQILQLENDPNRRRYKQAIQQLRVEWNQRKQEQAYIQAQLTRMTAEYDLLKTTERIRYLAQVIADVERWPLSPRREHDLYLARQELG